MPSYTSNGKNVEVVVYEPQRSGTFPALIVVHGSSGPVSSFVGNYAQQLANFGYVVFFVHYFDATATSYASFSGIQRNFRIWMAVIADGIGFAQRHAKVDSARIGLLGVSLGGYLSLSLASQDARVTAVVSLMGGMPPDVISATQDMPPTLLLHGEADPVVPVSEAYAVERLLKTLGTKYELKTYPGQGHSFRGVAQLDALTRTLKFLSRHLKNEKVFLPIRELLLNFR